MALRFLPINLRGAVVIMTSQALNLVLGRLALNRLMYPLVWQ